MYSPTVDPVEETLRRQRIVQHDDERPRPQKDSDEAPETPTDEPQPVPIQDPPAEPDRAPYVVRGRGPGGKQD
jgi:hypothetical protein